MTYQEQQDILFEHVFKKYYYHKEAIEIIISSHCNQNCQYCYLRKYGSLTYTKESNDVNNILHNLPILLNWWQEVNHNFKSYDLFSGEFFALPYWEKVLQIIYDFHKDCGCPRRTISIPTNCSFITDDQKTQKIELWISKLKDINCHLYMSLSVDGPEDVEEIERPSKFGQKSKEFYDKIFDFSKKYTYGFHPMVTKTFVKNYKQNYDWWIDNIIDKEIMVVNPGKEPVYSIPMFLEVRDSEEWDEESLENYRQFLWYVAKTDIEKLHKGNIKDFAYHMLDDFTDATKDFSTYSHVQPYLLALPTIHHDMSCSIQTRPFIRVGDLAVVPCHRTSYPNMIYGYLRLDDKKENIVGFKGSNSILCIKINNLSTTRSIMGCNNCEIKHLCMNGCLGSQYEHTKELFASQEPVCKMIKTKYKTIHEIAKHYNIYDIIENTFGLSEEKKEIIKYDRKIFEQL